MNCQNSCETFSLIKIPTNAVHGHPCTCNVTTLRCSKNRRFITIIKVAQIATQTHTHPFNSPFSGTTQVSRYQKGKTNLDYTEARDSEWQCHQLGYMQVCTSLQTDNHASTTPLSFLQAGCPSCCLLYTSPSPRD